MNFLNSLRARQQPPSPPPVDQSWQVPLVQAICAAMIRKIPSDWNSAHMALTPRENGIGYGLSHSPILRSLDKGLVLSQGEYVMPDTDVMAATRRFELAWVEHDLAPFDRAIISATRTAPGKDWEIKSDYKYPE